MNLGFAGRIAKAFIDSPLTPLLLFAALAVGAVGLLSLPREEEPQISVPMVDIFVRADGLKAVDAVKLVTEPLEDIVKGIDDVEHVYSRTEDDRVVVTARFFVGTDKDRAVLRVHDTLRANFDRIPIGIPEPLIVGRGIDDVAIVVLTLTPNASVAARWTDADLYRVALDLQHELVKVEDVGLSYIVGGRPSQIRVEPDPERLALYGITLNQLVDKVRNANRSFEVGRLRERDSSLPVAAGQTLRGIPDIGLLLLTTRDGRPVYVRDVAHVVIAGRPDEHRVWHLTPARDGALVTRPAVSLALAKRKGANAVAVADQILERLALVRGRVVPPGIEIAVTRNYGRTAQQKVDELLFHLLLATVSIVALVALAIGWREGVVIAAVIPATVLLTFFASWLVGYTINRVSLFALIFAIGIIVDDAIVIIENIARRWRAAPGAERVRTAIAAVAEVGNPTIVATLTIVVALVPMLFVSGLMGPYMSPIPANASVAMFFSFFVAVIVAPWLLLRLVGGVRLRRPGAEGAGTSSADVLGRIYRAVARPLLSSRWNAGLFLLAVAAATVASGALFATRDVTAKLLPFDNKSELEVVVDLPEGSSLEATERALFAAARRLGGLPELSSLDVYAGTAAPFNFNGLVRHYYLRASPELGELGITLVGKDARARTSHEIAREVRRRLAGLEAPAGTALKVVEVPPGPPVLSTLLAEIYGPDAETRRAVARKVRAIFEDIPFVTDVDDSLGQPPERLRLAIDQENLEFHGVEQKAVYDTIEALLDGVAVGYSYRGEGIYPLEIAIRLPKRDLALSERLLSTPVAAGSGAPVELGDVVKVVRERASFPLFRRDGRFIEMVTGELAGAFEAPIYGMLAVSAKLDAMPWGAAGRPAVRLHGQPEDESHPTLLWDGEWEITYVTFRDLGLAFAAAIVGIYLLIVAEFRSFRIPFVVMTPIPLTLVGIVPGHWLFGAPFTATSMIGFIALAGIIVRNSILLVDFIRHERAKGLALQEALLNAGAIRFRPILLTALAAMIGAAVILFDPIFQGLAISLLFGLAASTALTLLVIPAIYLVFRGEGRRRAA